MVELGLDRRERVEFSDSNAMSRKGLCKFFLCRA